MTKKNTTSQAQQQLDQQYQPKFPISASEKQHYLQDQQQPKPLTTYKTKEPLDYQFLKRNLLTKSLINDVATGGTGILKGTNRISPLDIYIAPTNK